MMNFYYTDSMWHTFIFLCFPLLILRIWLRLSTTTSPTWYRVHSCVVQWSIKSICQKQTRCRPNQKYNTPCSPFLLPSAWKWSPCSADQATSIASFCMENPTNKDRFLLKSNTRSTSLLSCHQLGKVAKRSFWAIELMALCPNNNNNNNNNNNKNNNNNNVSC